MAQETRTGRTVNSVCLAVALAASALWPGAAMAASTITGVVTFDGKAPALKPITMEADPACAKKHTAPVASEALVLGNGNTMGNILVWVSKGLPAGKTWPVPQTPVTIDQNGCMYRPRAQVVMAGQTIQIRNSDQTLHNVHTYRGASTMFNQAQIPGMAPLTKTLTEGGQIIKFKCDVHPWMTGYVAVATNPFFAVSGADGNFTIDKLPAGTYTVEAWHERLGTRTADVTVTEGQPAKLQLEFAAL